MTGFVSVRLFKPNDWNYPNDVFPAQEIKMNSRVLCISGLHNSTLTSGCILPRIWDGSAGLWKGKLLAEGLKRINYHHAKLEEIFFSFLDLWCGCRVQQLLLQVQSPVPQRSALPCPCCRGISRISDTLCRVLTKLHWAQPLILTPQLTGSTSDSLSRAKRTLP